MPSKYKIIMEMASQTARDVTSNVERYTDFLVTAANNYKYSFKEQLLIHAQKPEATACAEIETWNRLGRWVNKGTKGIALLVDRDIPYKLRHVFDISDTNSRAGITIALWQILSLTTLLKCGQKTKSVKTFSKRKHPSLN